MHIVIALGLQQPTTRERIPEMTRTANQMSYTLDQSRPASPHFALGLDGVQLNVCLIQF